MAVYPLNQPECAHYRSGDGAPVLLNRSDDPEPRVQEGYFKGPMTCHQVWAD